VLVYNVLIWTSLSYFGSKILEVNEMEVFTKVHVHKPLPAGMNPNRRWWYHTAEDLPATTNINKEEASGKKKKITHDDILLEQVLF